ncbi:amidohydrolase family protein [Falsirhodobacter algicola]|uniref:Amidohydrolase family protein n=1 Tax=Falsirhodobacter algicola TaxID=2692330 RepID=A0A8J8MTT0_9RHOB|nr:amidohydrolase family protein [Falsirhodobacter algicola]QUS36304.1 amidohydrolase family protein [Falsirhodobacter algicola]
MNTIVRNARLPGAETAVDILVQNGKFAAIAPNLSATGEEIDAKGRLIAPGFIETHIHLDKSCIVDRCSSRKGDLPEAIAEVARVKTAFTAEDVYTRAKRTLEKAILQGTTHMRTHVEVDPGIGMRGFDGVLALIEEYRWAIDIEICVFPQEGLLNNPGTDTLMVEALTRGARVVGAAPYTDSDPQGQIDRVFEMARDFDVDIDMHLDFGASADQLDLEYVCALTDRFGYGGRVAIGHATKLAFADPGRFTASAKRLADAGVALTVLPSTDLFLMGRDSTCGHPRGVTHSHKLLHHGVNCSLSTNNVLNPFTPFGDCSLVRMANLNANICHIGSAADIEECFNMVTTRSARLLNLKDYGIAVGNTADFCILDSDNPVSAVAELAPVLDVFKRGRRTVTRAPAEMHRPH